MLQLDLRVAVLLLLILWIATLCGAIWLDRRSRNQRKREPTAAHLSTLLESAPVGLLTLDGDACLQANHLAQQLFSLPASSAVLPPAAWVDLLNEDRAAARATFDGSGCYRSLQLSDERSVRWWVMHWQAQDLVLVLDDSAARHAQDAARFLISDLSHELRTPVATLLTHLQVLELSTISNETRQQSLHLMKEEAKRMSRLVHDLLELGRLETSVEIEHRPIDLLPLAEDAVAELMPQARAGNIVLSLQAGPSLPRIAGDADRLKQVLINLLDNAVKYSRPGDRVMLSLQCDRSNLVCTVHDTGPGIPAKHLPYLTRRFYRAAPEGTEGSGLGLALAEEILHRHSSHLEIESRSEGAETGTSVRFALPILN